MAIEVKYLESFKFVNLVLNAIKIHKLLMLYNASVKLFYPHHQNMRVIIKGGALEKRVILVIEPRGNNKKVMSPGGVGGDWGRTI